MMMGYGAVSLQAANLNLAQFNQRWPYVVTLCQVLIDLQEFGGPNKRYLKTKESVGFFGENVHVPFVLFH